MIGASEYVAFYGKCIYDVCTTSLRFIEHTLLRSESESKSVLFRYPVDCNPILLHCNLL